MSAEPETDPEEESEEESTPDPETEEETAERPKKRKKKRKKKKRAKKSEADRDDGEGSEEREEPLPGAGTPEGERLAEARRLFEVGDYAEVRAIADALAEAEDPAVRDAARELRSRTEVDPVQVVVALACFAVLITIVAVWIL